MRGERGTRGAHSVEYVGVLAVVTLLVTGLLATGAAEAAAGRVREAVCQVVGTGCAPVAAALAVQPLMSRPIAAVTVVDRDRDEGWRDCPEDRLCLWPDSFYGGRPYVLEVTDADPDVELPGSIRDDVGSWVNNTPWDLCGENLDFWEYRNEVPLTGSTHPDGGNRGAAGSQLDRVDHIGTCDDVTVEPDPAMPMVDWDEEPPERSDCGIAQLCLYSAPDFGGELLMEVDVGDCGGDDDCRITLPPGARDRVSSWDNGGFIDFCLVDEDEDRSYPTQTTDAYRGADGWWTREAMDAEMSAGANDTVDALERCDRELEPLRDGRFETPEPPSYAPSQR